MPAFSAANSAATVVVHAPPPSLASSGPLPSASLPLSPPLLLLDPLPEPLPLPELPPLLDEAPLLLPAPLPLPDEPLLLDLPLLLPLLVPPELLLLEPPSVPGLGEEESPPPHPTPVSPARAIVAVMPPKRPSVAPRSFAMASPFPF
jgi:hypothetical protein